MTTLVYNPDSRPKPSPRLNEPVRFVSVFANLLPDEVVASRRLGELKRRVVIGLVVLLILLIGWYALSMWGTSNAKDDLTSAQQQTTTLQAQQRTFGPLVSAQAQSVQISSALTKLMAGDVQWTEMLTTLRASAKGAITLTSITGSMTAGAASTGASAGGLGVLNQTGKQQVGTLTLTGTAPDNNTVAAYVDTLAKVKGLAAPFPASVTGTGGKLTFSVSVIITSDALGGRYAPVTAAGGK
ncbi:MAG: hypothetical protein ABI232_07960 [Jatrophihabitantaceae bacterium]